MGLSQFLMSFVILIHFKQTKTWTFFRLQSHSILEIPCAKHPLIGIIIKKYFLWILIVAIIPVATIIHQLILFDIYFTMLKHSQVGSCMIRLNTYFFIYILLVKATNLLSYQTLIDIKPPIYTIRSIVFNDKSLKILKCIYEMSTIDQNLRKT